MEDSKSRLPSVLIVEDEPDTANLIGITLREAGFDTDIVPCVQEAQEYLQSTAVDLLIVDWHLPDGSGAQVCAASREVNPAVPIIMFSAAYTERALAIAEAKPDLYLAKPIRMNHLSLIVRQMLNRADG